jgi:hypothetical protein
MSASLLDRLATQLKSNKSAFAVERFSGFSMLLRRNMKTATMPASLNPKVTSGLWWKAKARASNSRLAAPEYLRTFFELDNSFLARGWTKNQIIARGSFGQRLHRQLGDLHSFSGPFPNDTSVIL